MAAFRAINLQTRGAFTRSKNTDVQAFSYLFLQGSPSKKRVCRRRRGRANQRQPPAVQMRVLAVYRLKGTDKGIDDGKRA